MNRIVLAAAALLALGAGVYVFLRPASPSTASGGAGPNQPGATAALDPKVELVDPKSVAPERAVLERPTDAARPTGSAAVPASNAPGPGAAAEARHDPGVPANLPAIEDVDEAPFVDKYANATPDERRQALDSLVLTYKDAASGRIKNSEQLLKELEVEMQWLERHLDP